jgi:hypothetical protein
MMWVIFIRLLSHGGTMKWFFFPAILKESRVATLYKRIRSFRDIDRDGLLGAAASLDWSAVWSKAGVKKIVFLHDDEFAVGYICASASDQGHRRRQIMQRSQLVWRECGAFAVNERFGMAILTG